MIKPNNHAFGAKENKQTGLRPWECTPSAYGTSPGGGGLLSASL